MNKYINADELTERYSSEENCYPTDDYFMGYVDGIIFCHQMLDEMPSADVVEVMRCKDCKYYKESKYFAHEKACYRYKDNEGNKIGYIKSDNDFCSYGERKETK